MNAHDPSNPPQRNVGDENVERLLNEAYPPLALDERFVRQVRERIHATATPAQDLRSAVARDAAPRSQKRWNWRLTVGGGMLAALVVMIVLAANYMLPQPQPPSYYTDGQFIWVDGKPYIAAAAAHDQAETSGIVPLVEHPKPRRDQQEAPRVADALTPAKRSEAPQRTQVVAGDSLATQSGERRLVALADGSLLYVNENSSIQIDAERQITLKQGEVFLDVSKGDDASGRRFVVRTPQRHVTALGTKFSVTVDQSEARVVVTQGKVKVDGVDGAVEAGQVLRWESTADKEPVTSVARTSHVLRWTRELMAAMESPLVPDSEYVGGALVATDRGGHQAELSLRNYHIDVHIEDGFARTTIDQTYFNHLTARLEGTFYFPLPPDASISRLAMYVNGQLMEGGMAERDHARQVFETIKYRALDPALLEWIDGSTFKMRIFPLEGRQEKRIILSYTQKLDNHYGDLRYRFPAGHDLDTVDDWSVKLRLVQGDQWEWASPSHQFHVTEKAGDLVLTAAEQDAQLNRDIVVDLHEKETGASQGARPRFCSIDRDGWRYLMLRFRPQIPAAELQQRRDWVFLVESDGSRNPLLARVQADIVRLLLENAEPEDTFAIITASTRRHTFAVESKPVNRKNIEAAVDFLDATHLVGALDLEQALAATKPFVRNAANPVVVHIGDGTPILGEREHDRLLRTLPEGIRYVGIGVGKRWNRAFMKSAASRTGGYFTQVNPDEPTAWRVFELASTLNTPRLLNLRVEHDTGEEQFLCVKDWAVHGEEICAIARFKPAQAAFQSLQISGSIDAQPYRHEIAIDEVADGAGYLPRTWAKLAIDEMVAHGAVKHKAEIVQLSKTMYVLSPFTSLLVLENDEMYEQYGVDRGRKDHWALYPCPETMDVVHEPREPGTPAAQPADNAPDKPGPAEVLGSLWLHELDAFRRRDLLFGTTNPIRVTPRFLVEQEDSALPFDALITGNSSGATAAADFDALIRLIISSIRADTWDEISGRQSRESFPVNLSLVISQTQEVHEKYAERLLTSAFPVADLVIPAQPDPSLRFDWAPMAFQDEPPIYYPTPTMWYELTQGRSAYGSMDLSESRWSSEQRILAALDRRVDIRYINRMLKEIVDELAAHHEIPIVIDTKALEHAGIDSEERVTLVVNDVTLRSALTLLLKQLDLAFLIEDEVLQITTAEAAAYRAIPPVYWHDEILLPLDTRGVTPANMQRESIFMSMADDQRTLDRLFDEWTRRLVQNAPEPKLLYTRPEPFNNQRMFRHLVAFAPAFRTSRADVLAALESEAEWPAEPRLGKIDQDARRLISAARREGWQQVTLSDQAGRVVLTARVNEQGHFRYERKTEHGLQEIALCDGRTLRHLYPELGLGTVRRMSRFHQAELRHLFPWLLPPAEELAMGNDLRLIGPRTVAIVPHAQDQAVDDSGAPSSHVRVHLVFADSGRLAQRQWVAIPSGEVLIRALYEPDGTIAWFSRNDRLPERYRITTEASSRPDLSPETRDLVVLPMPVRSRSHIYQRVLRRSEAANTAHPERRTGSQEQAPTGDVLQLIADNQEHANDPASWDEDDALRLVAACYWQDVKEMRNVIARRFFARHDRRIGFYTLLLSSGVRWNPDELVELGDETSIRMDPVADHPESALARYIASELRASKHEREAQGSLDSRNRFIGQLSQYRRLCATWQDSGDLPTDVEVREGELDEALEFILHCDSPTFALALLRRIQNRYESAQPHARIAEALLALEKQGVTSYVVKYELARSLAANSRRDEARQLFLELHQDALDHHLLPPIDMAFREAFSWQSHEGDPFGNPFAGPDLGFDEVMRRACGQLIAQHQRPTAVALAWQCRQLRYEALADRLLDQALTGIPDSERMVTTLAAVEYLVHADRFKRAAALLQPLLEDQRYATSPSLWRLAAQIAEDGAMLSRSVMYLERALDLEYDALTGTYDGERVRANYQLLFQQYEMLTMMLAVPDADVPSDLVARIMRQADRWRSLETDVTAACRAAADLLSMLGQDELAWDYLTTPLAMRPNESAPWLELAESLTGRGQVDLADRAYETAFNAEPTNAQILWDHAEMLDQWGRTAEAQKLYSQIAAGQWQPRFERLKNRAQRLLSGNASN